MVTMARPVEMVNIRVILGQRGPKVEINGRSPRLRDLVGLAGKQIGTITTDGELTHHELKAELARLGVNPREHTVEIVGAVDQGLVCSPTMAQKLFHHLATNV